MNTTDLTFNDLPKVVGELCRSLHLLLQDKEGQHSGYQARKAPLYLS